MELAAAAIFSTLRDDEIEILQNSPALVTILIAGADDKVDKSEVESAVKYLTKAKDQYPVLIEYIENLKVLFKDSFQRQAAALPKPLEARQEVISTHLGKLSSILPKLDPECSKEIKRFLVDLGREVAGASGGVLGMNKISKAEAKYLPLDMIQI